MNPESAYHEAGHAVIAVLLGGRVLSATIERDWLDRPDQAGSISVAWQEKGSTAQTQIRNEVLTLLAGPAAEMVYTGEPLHPATVAQWQDDWERADRIAATIAPDELKRLRLLESACSRLFQFLSDDRCWQAVSEIADLLDAHESIEGEEIHSVVARWVG